MVKQKKNKKIIIQGRDMIEELRIENLPGQKQQKILSEMGKALYDRILLQMIKKLSNKEAEKVNDFLERGETEKAFKYIETKVLNFGAIIKKEVKTFQKEMMKAVKGKVA